MTPDAAVRAIARLRNARDELELAARTPGQLVTLSRQAVERIPDDMHHAARPVRKTAEGGRD
jgi:hypothetical protein